MPYAEAGAWDGSRQIWLCHPDDESLPDCYSEWSWSQAHPGHDGRFLADQLIPNAPPVHIPIPGKRLHRTGIKLPPI